MKLSIQDSTLARLQTTLRDTEEEVRSLKDLVAQQKDELHAGEMERRRLHNTIQELKAGSRRRRALDDESLLTRDRRTLTSLSPLQGNIRVFCRVRPLVDGGLSKQIQLPASDNKTITLAKTEEVGSV